MKDIVVGMKGLFDGAGAARAASIMKHVDDVESLKAVAKMTKRAAEPTATLVRMHGADGVKAIRRLSKAEDGAETLAKAARKGPRGLKLLVRSAKSLRHGHPQRLARMMAGRWIAILSGLLVGFGLFKLRVWRIVRFALRKKRKEAQA